MDFECDIIENQNSATVRKAGGGSIVKGVSDEPYTVDANIYLYREDLQELVKGERIHTEQRKNILNIYPPDETFEDIEEWGHYDDVLVALEEMYIFIEQLEQMAPGLLRYTEKDKLKNTYLHYKKQEERYR